MMRVLSNPWGKAGCEDDGVPNFRTRPGNCLGLGLENSNNSRTLDFWF